MIWRERWSMLLFKKLMITEAWFSRTAISGPLSNRFAPNECEISAA